MTDAVLTGVRKNALWITINRPEAHNALNKAVTRGLLEALQRAGSEPDVRAVVLTGAGERTFCAGADLKEGHSEQGRSTFSSTGGENPLVAVYRAMKACPKPVLWAISCTVIASWQRPFRTSTSLSAKSAGRAKANGSRAPSLPWSTKPGSSAIF